MCNNFISDYFDNRDTAAQTIINYIKCDVKAYRIYLILQLDRYETKQNNETKNRKRKW